MSNKFTKEAENRYINDQNLNNTNLDQKSSANNLLQYKVITDAYKAITKELHNVSQISEIDQSPINTIWFPYTFKYDSLNSNPPQRSAFLLLKTYLHLILKKYDMVSPDYLYQIFNTTQQIVELPRALVLYLGGLYRLNSVDSQQEKDIKTYDEVLDYVSPSFNDIQKLIQKANNNTTRGLHFYDKGFVNKQINFSFNSAQELQTASHNPSHTTVPYLSYGIYSSFLHHYNKYMFGTYLNGSKTDVTHSNIFSGYCTNILKPIKTYKVSMDFTALYRILSLGDSFGQNIKLEDISKVWEEQGRIHATVNVNVIGVDILRKLFLAYSKLKVLYLMDRINAKELKDFIERRGEFFKKIVDVFFSPYLKGEDEQKVYSSNLPESFRVKKDKNVADFLIFLWDIEKANMLPQYKTIDTKLTFALYPSAGGYLDLGYLASSNIAPPTTRNPQPRTDGKDSRHISIRFTDPPSIHGNTVRLLWFENPKYAYQLEFGYKTLNNKLIKINYDKIFKHNKINFIPTTESDEKDILGKYSISMLMDSLDFEKLESFGLLFDDFVNNKRDGFDNFTLKSLLLASTVFGGEELIQSSIGSEDLLYQLVGNSAYNYDFVCYSGIASIINITLTNYQELKCNNVINEFLSNKVSIANFTPMGSVEHNASNIQPHNFPVSLDFIFGQPNGEFDYTDFMSQFGGSDDVNTIRYFARKVLFGDQYIKPYRDIGIKGIHKRYMANIYKPNNTTSNDDAKITPENRRVIKKIVELNRIYLTNDNMLNTETWYTSNAYNISGSDKTAIDNTKVEKTFLLLVNNFFEFLNIEITEDNYKLLFRLIRSFIASSIKDTININATPSNTQK